MSRYVRNFGQNPYNPPDYYQSMITDPSQIPVQYYPGGGGGGAYGYPGGATFGPYPGFYLGSRILEQKDAIRLAKARQDAMVRRADTTDRPEHKYLTPGGRVKGAAGVALRSASARRRQKPPADIVGPLQKKILTTVLLGAVLSALLR